MKNYKILIVSLLLLIFMVGAVSAADENATDDLEITDEISVEEEVVASSDVVEEVDSNAEEVLAVADVEDNSSDEEVLTDNHPDPFVVEVDDYPDFDEVYFLYNEKNYLTFQFVDGGSNPYSDVDVVIRAYSHMINDWVEYESHSDDEGYATILFDAGIGFYEVAEFILDNDIESGFGLPVIVYDPNVTGYILYSSNGRYISNDLSNDDIVEYINYGQTFSREISFTTNKFDGYNNKLIYYSVNGVTYNATTVSSSYVIITLDSLPAGVNNLSVTAPELDLTRNIIINVNSSISAENADFIRGAENNYAMAFYDANGAPLANENVNVTVAGENNVLTTNDTGVALLNLANLPGGEYAITIVNPVTGENVTRTVNMFADKTVFADDVTAVYGESSKFAANFTDKYGNPLVNSTVAFIVNGQSVNATTDEKGIASFDIDFNSGNITVTVLNPITGNEINKTITINKANAVLTATNVNMVYNNPKATVITLKANNKILPNQNITVVLNGKTYNLETNNKGQATLSVNLPVKTHTATVKFAGDNNYLNAQTTAKIKVTKATPKMTAKAASFKIKAKTKKYSIVLKDNKNKALSKAKVTLKVKGKTYKATTNAKGKATFKITKLTKKGKYTAKVNFAGNSNFKAVSKSVKLTVKK